MFEGHTNKQITEIVLKDENLVAAGVVKVQEEEVGFIKYGNI